MIKLLTRNRRVASPAASLSMFDPIWLGHDAFADPVTMTLAYRNVLLGGEPGGGKSNAVHLCLGHAALARDVDRMILFDGKRLELTMYRPLADEVVGPDIDRAIAVLDAIRADMDVAQDELEAAAARKITARSQRGWTVIGIDELAVYTSVLGEPRDQKAFSTRLRDVVARGRATGHIVIAATQRPSVDIVPSSLRDLFAYRWAFRCTNDASSDVVLGDGWSNQGYTANDIEPNDACAGIGYVLAEGGIPKRFKTAYLTDNDIARIVTAGLALRVARGHRSRPLTGDAA